MDKEEDPRKLEFEIELPCTSRRTSCRASRSTSGAIFLLRKASTAPRSAFRIRPRVRHCLRRDLTKPKLSGRSRRA